MVAAGEITEAGCERLRRSRTLQNAGVEAKTDEDVRRLFDLIHQHGSLDYAAGIAAEWARRAQASFDKALEWLPPSVHRDVLETLVSYVHQRQR